MVKRFKEFLESISGTEMMGDMGPGYGSEQMPVTLNKSNTEVVYSDVDSKFYSKDDYDEVYNEYLKKGGKPLFGFNIDNLSIILLHLSNSY